MAMPLKEIYSIEFYEALCIVLNKYVVGFENDKAFKKAIFCKDWISYPLKTRLRHTTETLHKYIHKSPEVAVEELLNIAVNMNLRQDLKYVDLALMFLPDFIELYLQDDLDLAFTTFERITPYTSCEFAIRPFIDKKPELAMSIIYSWNKHPNYHVRRLASEGTRPSLPWAIALKKFQRDPKPIWKLLELLKNDLSEYVRLSVSNNMNDISKFYPDQVITKTRSWFGESVETNKLLKHACRTLLKKGDPAIMEIFGYLMSPKIKISNFILNQTVNLGEKLGFTFQVNNHLDRTVLVRLEYIIHYRRKDGSLFPKVFKISERELQGQSHFVIEKKHSFKIITTRTFYTGMHSLSIVLNGMRLAKMNFKLLEKALP